MSSEGPFIESLKSAEDKKHILVVDDDERLRGLLSKFLREHDFLVSTAVDAAHARNLLASWEYDLIVLDVMMPGETGVELTRALQDTGQSTPVLLLTALDEVDSRIEGLEAGADDYLPKPFEPKELLLRIHAILRRTLMSSKSTDHDLLFGAWSYDIERGVLSNQKGEYMMLTQTEQGLLKALASRVGHIIGREDLARMCGLESSERTIDVQITRLRKKLEPDSKSPRYIQTVRGKGYVLRPDEKVED